MNPAETLLERLSYGLSDPDQELFDRAASCVRWFNKYPIERLRWLPRLRETGRLNITAQLWEAVRLIVEPEAVVRPTVAGVEPFSAPSAPAVGPPAMPIEERLALHRGLRPAIDR